MTSSCQSAVAAGERALHRKRILFGHSYWGRGGAEVAAMWALQALCRDYRVDVVTRGGLDLSDLNRSAGTNIQRDHLGAVLHPTLAPSTNGAGGALWHALYLRHCRRLAPQYDLCITASRTLRWGRFAIHFLTDVAWNRHLQKRFNCPEAERAKGFLRKASFALCSRLAGNSSHDPQPGDLLVANSKWTAAVSAEYSARPPVVIYPAVPHRAGAKPWKERENAFLCLGRISPEKQIERVVAILDQVRVLGHSVWLHVIGIDDCAVYPHQIRRLCQERKEWVVFHGPLYGSDKLKMLGRCRYGLSACEREAFGIATAEMAAAGVIPFVPRVGAQEEIVQEPDLIYGDIEDAALKIDAVLKSPPAQRRLHAAMLERGANFTPQKFCSQVRELVANQLASTVQETSNNTRPASAYTR